MIRIGAGLPLPPDRARETAPRARSHVMENRVCPFGAAYFAVAPAYDQSPGVRGASIQFVGAGAGAGAGLGADVGAGVGAGCGVAGGTAVQPPTASRQVEEKATARMFHGFMTCRWPEGRAGSRGMIGLSACPWLGKRGSTNCLLPVAWRKAVLARRLWLWPGWSFQAKKRSRNPASR